MSRDSDSSLRVACRWCGEKFLGYYAASDALTHEQSCLRNPGNRL